LTLFAGTDIAGDDGQAAPRSGIVKQQYVLRGWQILECRTLILSIF
jgi:hypothetical protein